MTGFGRDFGVDRGTISANFVDFETPLGHLEPV